MLEDRNFFPGDIKAAVEFMFKNIFNISIKHTVESWEKP